jgi:hypothetical protein
MYYSTSSPTRLRGADRIHCGAQDWILFYYYYYLLTSYLLTYLLIAIELSLGGSSPYTSTEKTNKKKYT